MDEIEMDEDEVRPGDSGWIEQERRERDKRMDRHEREHQWTFLVPVFLLTFGVMALLGNFVYGLGRQALVVYAFSFTAVLAVAAGYGLRRDIQRLEENMSDVWWQLNEIRTMMNRRHRLRGQP